MGSKVRVQRYTQQQAISQAEMLSSRVKPRSPAKPRSPTKPRSPAMDLLSSLVRALARRNRTVKVHNPDNSHKPMVVPAITDCPQTNKPRGPGMGPSPATVRSLARDHSLATGLNLAMCPNLLKDRSQDQPLLSQALGSQTHRI
ncbi:hypothetical protein VdG1_02480 [Verticillium dahliae VDG1]|nr:hypothetical protein VdG1_02480 [Verticillium dahliae VDG1]